MKLKKIPLGLIWTLEFVVFSVTFSYHFRLTHCTVLPIKQIVASHGNDAIVRKLLLRFRAGKEQELRHVRVAVRFLIVVLSLPR
jgi:hypothetical protein